ncbi:MAG: hypothetical protein PVJ39_00710 [Gammaproteobacteria bacterium]
MRAIEQPLMATPTVQKLGDDNQKILMSFARQQLSHIESNSIKKNSFQLFLITAFLYGAIQQLGKQSTLPKHLSNHYLHKILIETFSLPPHNAEGLVSSINRMMKKYYLLENIYFDGESAAEQWLVNDECECTELKTLLDRYENFTMLDMNAAGMKSDVPAFDQPQDRDPTPDTNGSSGGTLKFVVALIALAALAGVAYFFSLKG